MTEPDKPVVPSEPPAPVAPLSAPVAPPPEPAPPVDPVADAQRRTRWAQIAGPGQLHAAVLGLLLSPGRVREQAVWDDECSTTPGGDVIRTEALADRIRSV